MAFDADRVETVTVDSYGTLVDPSAAEAALAAAVEEPEPVSERWRSRSLRYTMVANAVGEYRPFYEINRDALRHALDAHGVDLAAAEREEILSVYHELDVYDDVRDGIGRLVDGGYDVYVVSNGNPSMLDSVIEHAGIGDLIADAVSAHEVETFKPDAELYRHAAARTGTPIREIAHVAGPAFDVQGAKGAGMQGVRIDRGGDGARDPFGADPDLRIGTFYDLADELGV